MADHSHPVDPERVDIARARSLNGEDAAAFHDLIGVIGEPVRARILSALLAAEELCVGDVALALDISEDAASYGLRVLRERGLVARRTQGRMGFYRVADGPKREPLLTALNRLARLAGTTSQLR